MPCLRKLEPWEMASRAFIILFKHLVEIDMPHYSELRLYLLSLVWELLESSASLYCPQIPAPINIPSFSKQTRKQTRERALNKLGR